MAGKKGRSGRKTIRQEIKDIRRAERIFFDELDQQKLEAKIASGKFSIADRFKLTAMEGDTTVISKAYHKAVPEIVEHSGPDGGPIQSVQEISISFDE